MLRLCASRPAVVQPAHHRSLVQDPQTLLLISAPSPHSRKCRILVAFGELLTIGNSQTECAYRVSTLPVPAGSEDSSDFADARACTFGPGSQSDSLLLVAYSNQEMVLWDIQDLAEVLRLAPDVPAVSIDWCCLVTAVHLLRSHIGCSGRNVSCCCWTMRPRPYTVSTTAWNNVFMAFWLCCCRSTLCAALHPIQTASGTSARSACCNPPVAS